MYKERTTMFKYIIKILKQ